MRLLWGLVLVVCLSACSQVDVLGDDRETSPVAVASSLPATVWFRTDEPETSMLVRAERPLTDAADPVRAALQELIDGPRPGEGMAVLDPGVRIDALRVRRGVADVRLVGRLIPPGPRPSGPHADLLGVAAVVNTLTEFPSVRAVRLDVDEEPRLWGLPDVLVRDESFIAPALRHDPQTPVSDFGERRRRAGTDPAGADAARVVSVRLIDRLAYVRVSVELEDARGGGDVVDVPLAEAVPVDGGLRLIVRGVDVDQAVSGPLVAAGDPRTGGGLLEAAEVSDHDGVLDVRLSTVRRPRFALATDVSPSRIILDVMK